MSKILDQIYDSQRLYEISGLINNADAQRDAFRQTSEIQELKLALKNGSVNEQQIRKYVDSILTNLRTGETFEGNIFLAAVAVALVDIHNSFAEEFISDLAALKRSEMSASIRVAKSCVAAKAAQPKNHWPKKSVIHVYKTTIEKNILTSHDRKSQLEPMNKYSSLSSNAAA